MKCIGSHLCRLAIGDTGFLQPVHGALAGIHLHRQGDKREQGGDREKTDTHWHVILNPFDDNKLQVVNRKMFRDFKRRYVTVAIRTLVRRTPYSNLFYTGEAKSTMDDVKKGAFYSTSFTDPVDIEARRQAYINWVIGLSDKKKGGKK